MMKHIPLRGKAKRIQKILLEAREERFHVIASVLSECRKNDMLEVKFFHDPPINVKYLDLIEDGPMILFESKGVEHKMYIGDIETIKKI